MKKTFYAFLATFLSFLLTGAPAIAQSTRILDGSYVSKFGQHRNFILNPDAQTNNANVQLNFATATQSLTTPISENGISEFNVSITTANGTIHFIPNSATQAILGGQQCEVGFRGRGFQSTSKLQAFDGSNVLATYTFGALTNTTNVSLPFPCPTDPSGIRVRLTDTAILGGTNEVAGVYFGRSRGIYDAGVVSDWQAYTPSNVQGFTATTISSNETIWRSVGNTIEIQGRFTTGTTQAAQAQWGLPNGYTIANVGGSSTVIAGKWIRNTAGATQLKQGAVLAAAGNTYIGFSPDDYTTATSPFTGSNGNAMVGSSEVFSFFAKVVVTNLNSRISAITPNQQIGFSAGEIFPTSTATCPVGSVVADGSAISRTTNSQLFAAIGITHGQGDNSTTFNVPDYRGRFLRGTDGSAGRDPDKAARTAMGTGGNTGNNVGSVQLDAAQSHVHDFSTYSVNNIASAGRIASGAGFVTGATNVADNAFISPPRTDGANGTPRVTSETRPLNAYVTYCVRLTSTGPNQPVYIQGPVKAAADGVAIATGFLGENKKTSVLRSSPVSHTSGAITPIAPAMTLTPGIWIVTGAVGYETAAGASVTAGTTQYSISDTGGHALDSTIGVPTAGNVQYRSAYAMGASQVQVFPFQPYLVTVAFGSTQILRTYASANTSGTVNVFGSLEATRIN